MGFDVTRECIAFFCVPVQVVHACLVGMKKSSVSSTATSLSVCPPSTFRISRNGAVFV